MGVILFGINPCQTQLERSESGVGFWLDLQGHETACIKSNHY